MRLGIALFIAGAAIMVIGLFVNFAGYFLYSWGFFLGGLALLLLARYLMPERPRGPPVP